MEILGSHLLRSPLFSSFASKADSPQKAFGLGGLPLLAAAGIIARRKSAKGAVYLVCPTEEAARSMASDALVALRDVETVALPSSSRVLYSGFEASRADLAQARCLSRILRGGPLLVIASLRAFVSRMAPRSMVENRRFVVEKGGAYDPMDLALKLSEAGYVRTTSTSMPGEFSIRGEVSDVFPVGAEAPFRIYTEWDAVARICAYDPMTQQPVREMDRAEILLIKPLAMEETQTILSYIGDDDYFVLDGVSRLESSYESLQSEARSLYRQAWLENPAAMKPSEAILDFPVFVRGLARKLSVLDLDEEGAGVHRFQIEGPRSYFGNFTFLKQDLEGLLGNGWTVRIYASTAVQKARLAQMLSAFPQIQFEVGAISGGFALPGDRHIVISEEEIFGRKKRILKTISKVQSSPIDSFVELEEGDYVVHVSYGIGRFLKIDRIRERDYIKIEYSQNEILYVPIEQANLVQRYIGSAAVPPHVDRLGGASWERKKEKARENAEKLAHSLLDLYARRREHPGFPYPKDTDWQLQFEAAFPYEETEDQLRCVDEIKEDMESPRVMDRLVCGDVGFGKTEVAFRAAFKAIMSSKQIAFLAPTTILAEQHYRNFVQRCGDFPVHAVLLSRLVGRKEQNEALRRLREGSADIAFGTHRLLQKDIVFANLGLLVVDEEQRFGVKDKERIKQLKSDIDCLSLSATPIPRTLYMSLLKIRDMSLLATPPIARRPISTQILRFDLDTAVEAIRAEIARQGQVFFLHNRIETLPQMVAVLQERLPDVAIEGVHGQMDPEEIGDKMRRFIQEGIQVLVSTTIIENGIDIPNVNTIIIDRADRYGLSQLYQLRGRVGRSDKAARAYLFYPGEKVLSPDAIKRLKVISEHTELGSGFKVALRDMEIRGAGNLLGKEQSGQMSAVGLDMYMRLLDEAISGLQESGKEPEREVFFELDYAGFIPSSYIAAPSIKFEIYRKIASVRDDASLTGLTAEIQSRFGPMPEEVSNLLYIAELKILCRKLKVYHLKEMGGNVTIEFSKLAAISLERLVSLVQTSNGAVRLNPRRPNVLIMRTEAISLKDKSLFLLEKLQRLVS